MYYEVMPAKRYGREGVLTYQSDDSLSNGQIVEIPLGRGKCVGIITKKVAQPNFECKKILKVFYSKPLPKHLIKAAEFIANYYKAPLSSVVELILPNGIEKQRRKKKTEQMFGIDSVEQTTGIKPKIALNPTQKMALERLQKGLGATKLLYGVTGSGKTNVYLYEASRALLARKSVILLVPEIALTGQLVRVFREAFGNRITLIHSRQTEAERHLIFEEILNSDSPRIIIGPRSALFAPISNLGLIIIDEEHENSYYQENTPKYSAIRVASFMANETTTKLILGSATPAIEDYYLAKTNDSLIIMSKKAKEEAIKPEVQVVDFKNRDNFSKNRYFSNQLIKSIKDNLEHGRQTLIFHNRRGSAPLTICEKCGEEIVCPNCFLPLTLHADTYNLICHTCDFKMRVPSNCPKCGAVGLIHKGFGTKLLESELQRLFPKARIKRFDADNKKGESLDAVYDQVRDGKIDILVGTQTIAKGLDLPNLATAGVVQADAGLSLPDYAAEERTFQLITQVIGRVGRGHLKTAEVVIQTFRPEHPVIKYATNEDYLGFSEYLLEQRRRAKFPPFTFVMKLEIAMKTEAIVLRKVRATVTNLQKDKRLIVSPPMPAFHERTARGFTWQIIVRSRSRKALLEACEGLDPNFHVSLDPPGLL